MKEKARAKAQLTLSLALLMVSAELLDESDIAELPPLHKAFCRLDYVERHWVVVSVRRLQAAVPDLDEEDALEIVAQVGVFLAGLTWLS